MTRRLGTSSRKAPPHGVFIKTHPTRYTPAPAYKPPKVTGRGRHKKIPLDPYGHPILVGANPPDPGNTPYIDNTPYQTANGAYLWLEQHPAAGYHPAPTPKPTHSPPNTTPPTAPAHHVHVHDPIRRVRIITQHPIATLPFTALIGSSSKTPHRHDHSAIAAQQARR